MKITKKCACGNTVKTTLDKCLRDSMGIYFQCKCDSTLFYPWSSIRKKEKKMKDISYPLKLIACILYFYLVVSATLGCKVQDTSDELTGDPELILVPSTLDDLYDDDYAVYNTSCPLNDHNCIDEDYIHEDPEFELCEALATWTYDSGKLFIMSDPRVIVDNFSEYFDMTIFYRDPNQSYGGESSWSLTARHGTSYTDSGDIGDSGVYSDNRILEFGECQIETNHSFGGSGPSYTYVFNAWYSGVLFFDQNGLLINQ